MVVRCAILGWFIWCHCTSGFSYVPFFINNFLVSRLIQVVSAANVSLLSRFTIKAENHIVENQVFNSKSFFCNRFVSVHFHQPFFSSSLTAKLIALGFCYHWTLIIAVFQLFWSSVSRQIFFCSILAWELTHESTLKLVYKMIFPTSCNHTKVFFWLHGIDVTHKMPRRYTPVSAGERKIQFSTQSINWGALRKRH